MSINLRSAELRKAIGNNGVLTDAIAMTRKNNITIDLSDIVNGEISSELVEDLGRIAAEYPRLLRHTTIINNTSTAVNMQPIVDILAKCPRPNPQLDSIKSIDIRSKFDEDFDLDFRRVSRIQKISFSGVNRVSKVRFDTSKLPQNPDREFTLSLSNFDLERLDLSGTKVVNLDIQGRGSRGFSGIAHTLTGLRGLTISDRELDREFYDMIDFVNGSSNLTTVGINGVNLSTVSPLEMLKNKNLVSIRITNARMRDLSGLEDWDGLLTDLILSSNDISDADFSRLVDFYGKNQTMYMSVTNNRGINNLFSTHSTERFSARTQRNILRTYQTVHGQRSLNNKDVLSKLLDDPTIPISLEDAEKVRKQVGLTLNPIEVPENIDVTTYDFDKDYLRDGTLLLSKEQIEKLIQAKKKVPMKLAVKIESAKDLTADEIKRLHFEAGVQEVRMLNDDSIQNTRMPYKAVEYYTLRQILDEVVDGINPTETEVTRFATVYQRLADTITYDHDAIDYQTTDKARYATANTHRTRNLANGLLSGTCVCAGYAEILRNALDMVGIKSRYLVGKCFDDPDYTGRHAWNAVNLDDGTGERKWYLTDLTWDAGHVGEGERRYTLLDGQTFTVQGHQVNQSYDLPVFSDEPFSREALDKAFDRAEIRFINPREQYRVRKEQRKAAEAERRKIEEEERKKQEEEERRKAAEKKKEEEEKKQGEDEGQEKKTTKKKVLSPEKEQERQELIEKRDYCRSEMDTIYHRLDTVLGLDQASKREYYRKLSELEERYRALEDKIDAFKEFEEEIEIEVEPELQTPTGGEELGTAYIISKEYEDRVNEEVDVLEAEFDDVTFERDEARRNNDFEAVKELDARRDSLMMQMHGLMGSLVIMSEEDRVSKQQDMVELQKELARLTKERDEARANNDTVKEEELSGRRDQVIAGIYVIYGSLNPTNFDGVERLLPIKIEKKDVPPVKSDDNKSKNNDDDTSKKVDDNQSENHEFDGVEVTSEEDIEKTKAAFAKKEEERRASIEETAKTSKQEKILPKIKTRDDLVAIKKQEDIRKWENKVIALRNKLFKKDSTELPKVVKGVIKFAVTTKFYVKDKMMDILDLDDPYMDELSAIYDSQAHTEEKREDFVFGKYDPKDSSKKFDRLVVAKQHKQDAELLDNIKDIKDELER